MCLGVGQLDTSGVGSPDVAAPDIPDLLCVRVKVRPCRNLPVGRSGARSLRYDFLTMPSWRHRVLSRGVVDRLADVILDVIMVSWISASRPSGPAALAAGETRSPGRGLPYQQGGGSCS